MYLQSGDRLLVTERHGAASYVCRVLSTWGPSGEPPFVVLRYDTGNEELLVPNADLELRVLTHAPA